MNTQATGSTMSKPKITTEVIRRYYVEIDGWVFGGPFETKEEAQECLKQAKQHAREAR